MSYGRLSSGKAVDPTQRTVAQVRCAEASALKQPGVRYPRVIAGHSAVLGAALRLMPGGVGGGTMQPGEFVPRRKTRPFLRPKCPACGALMWLAHIEPDKPRHDRRTFECPRCQEQITKVVKYR